MFTALPFWIKVTILLPLFACLGCQSSAAPQTTLSLWLDPNTPGQVDFPLTVSAQTYSFSASPTNPTVLTLIPSSADLTYTAEVRDNMGGAVATLGNLQGAALTIGPHNGVYTLTVKSDNQAKQGTLSLQVSGTTRTILSNTIPNALRAVGANPQTVAFASSANDPCRVSSATGGNVNIRSGPGLGYGVVGALTYPETLTAIARSDNAWYQVPANNQYGWISGSVSTLTGKCDNLPTILAASLLPPPTPTPMPAANIFQFQVDRDGWGNFSQNMTAGTDRSHIIQLTIANLLAQWPNNYREFNLTLACSGQGVESIRWGAPERPTLPCGETISLPFLPGYARQSLAVAFAGSSGVVRYNLMAVRR